MQLEKPWSNVVDRAREGSDEDNEIMHAVDEAIVQLSRRTDPHIPVIFYERVTRDLLDRGLIGWRSLLKETGVR